MKTTLTYELKSYLHYLLFSACAAVGAYVLCDYFLVPLKLDTFTLLRFTAFAGVIFTGLVWNHLQARHGAEKVVKGTQLVTPYYFLHAVEGKGVGIPTHTRTLRKSHTRLLRIREKDEAKHILICGDTGSGKSAIQHYLLHQILSRGTDSVVVYDPSLEFWHAHGRPDRGDVLLYPLDEACPYWDISSEIRDGRFTKVDAKRLAESILPDRDEGRVDFWDEAPREILTFLLIKLKREGLGNEHLLRWLSDPELLYDMVSGTAMTNLIDPAAPQQRAGVLSAFAKVVNFLELLPEDDGVRPLLSITEWTQQRKGNLFIATKGAAERSALRPLISTWLDLIFARLMLEMGGEPVWCFVDELPTLQRLPSLRDAIQESRKYNLRFVLGFQGRSQLEQRYGKEAEALMSAPDTRIFLKTSEPRAAEWIAQNVGQPRKEREQLSFSSSLVGRSQKSVSSRTEERTDYLIYPNEIQTLSEREGFLCYDKYAVRIQFDYPSILTEE